jgi:hypothetical protein
MDLVMNHGFCEMNQLEMMQLDGGTTVGQAVAGTVGIAAICWAAPVAIVVGSAGLGVGMAVAGAGAVINMF